MSSHLILTNLKLNSLGLWETVMMAREERTGLFLEANEWDVTVNWMVVVWKPAKAQYRLKKAP